ncbi:divalent cation tolerance protein CutA [Fulvivirga sp. M361]|uniref:divalent cation tolerance protein CutA n=1 Tax=Fulvivirga sp. M361 TaxID=2594266 RepID=UPI00117A4992|nr:divalent cation tolerance protein CutA [Fulvivirga sp. M361]TRX58227.1 divalent cation tolerance protein CutA [Fulvivirga sp. M361]
MVLIYLITKDAAEARSIGRVLIQERITNSANVIPRIQTLRWMDNEVQDTSETILLIKTKALLYSSIEKRVSELMGTKQPNIFSMPITQINHFYQDVLREGVITV